MKDLSGFQNLTGLGRSKFETYETEDE